MGLFRMSLGRAVDAGLWSLVSSPCKFVSTYMFVVVLGTVIC